MEESTTESQVAESGIVEQRIAASASASDRVE